MSMKQSAIILLAAVSTMVPGLAYAQQAGRDSQGCGWYIILGCSKQWTDANRRLDDLGGPMVGGGAGSRILDTSTVRGFRGGFFCVADGPYVSQADAGSVAWREAVPDAYVKRGC